jgi:CXC domain
MLKDDQKTIMMPETTRFTDKMIAEKGIQKRNLIELKLKESLLQYKDAKAKLRSFLFRHDKKAKRDRDIILETSRERRIQQIKRLAVTILKKKSETPQKKIFTLTTSDDFPLQTRLYIRIGTNMKNEDSNKINLFNLAAFKPGEHEIKPMQADLTRQFQLEKIENKINELEKHRLYYVCRWIVRNVGPEYINLVAMSSLLKVLPVALNRFWFKANQFKIKKNPILLSAYKNAQYFCSICLKYVCNLHYEELEDETVLIQSEEPDYEYSPYDTRYTCAKFKDDGIFHNLYMCPPKLKATCYRFQLYSDSLDGVMQTFEYEFIKRFCIKYGIHNPCMIRLLIDTQLTCQQIHKFIGRYQPYPKNTFPEELIRKGAYSEQKKKGRKPEYDQTMSWKQYLPCFHPLESCENCPCQARGNCDVWCGCPTTCPLRFKGCPCRPGQCKESSKCPCINNNRECDPEICKSCRSEVNLSVVKKYKLKVPCCPNTGNYYSVKSHLLLGKSSICEGMGLYAANNIQKGEYLGSYVGELIDNQEGSLRGIIYNIAGCSYMFDFDEYKVKIINGNNILDS